MSFEDYKKRLKLFMIPNSNNSEICILIFQVNETNLCSISALINCIPSRAPVVVFTLARSIVTGYCSSIILQKKYLNIYFNFHFHKGDF